MTLEAQIAVLLPIYNAEKFLRECLDSIVKQTYSDFILFACDDKSTDGSLDILNEYARNDIRIRILKNSDNIGCSDFKSPAFRIAGRNGKNDNGKNE